MSDRKALAPPNVGRAQHACVFPPPPETPLHLRKLKQIGTGYFYKQLGELRNIRDSLPVRKGLLESKGQAPYPFLEIFGNGYELIIILYDRELSL